MQLEGVVYWKKSPEGFDFPVAITEGGIPVYISTTLVKVGEEKYVSPLHMV